jgi:hypothetical protein
LIGKRGHFLVTECETRFRDCGGHPLFGSQRREQRSREVEENRSDRATHG